MLSPTAVWSSEGSASSLTWMRNDPKVKCLVTAPQIDVPVHAEMSVVASWITTSRAEGVSSKSGASSSHSSERLMKPVSQLIAYLLSNASARMVSLASSMAAISVSEGGDGIDLTRFAAAIERS